MPLRRLVPLLVALLVCVVAASCGDDGTVLVGPAGDAPEPGEPPPGDSEEAERRIERHVFDLVNEERRERGIPPLEWSEQLAQGARSWSEEMAARGAIEHQDPEQIIDDVDGLNAIGENVFEASRPLAASRIHIGWMRSEGHRRNVLDAGFDRLGVGVVCTDQGAVYATQRFGRTAGADLPRPGEGGTAAEEPIVAEPGEGPRCPAAGS